MRHGLAAGRLPKGCAYITRAVTRFRAGLEAAMVAAGLPIGLVEAATIQTAVRWERHACLCLRWLRTEELDPDQRLTFSREIARASSERDKCLRLLGLNHRLAADPWRQLDATSNPAPQGPQPE
jgi:hypothetical protein